MAFSVPKWVSDIAIVGLIFSVGGYAARIELTWSSVKNELQKIQEEKILPLDKKVVAIDTAISIHHGPNWSEKAKTNALKRVEDLEKDISDIKNNFRRYEVRTKIKSLEQWAEQADVLIKKLRLDKFRAIAIYSTNKTPDTRHISINIQHPKGKNFKIGDSLILENPGAGGYKVEATVKSLLDDPNNPEILVQLNEELLPELGLTTKAGQYELLIQGTPQTLRWKTIDEFYQKELAAQEKGHGHKRF